MAGADDSRRLEVTLRLDSQPNRHGHDDQAVYGLALEMLHSLAPGIARPIHDGSDPKPLSASPVMCAGDRCNFSLGARTADSGAALRQAFVEAQATGQPLGLADATATVVALDALIGSYTHPHAGANASQRCSAGSAVACGPSKSALCFVDAAGTRTAPAPGASQRAASGWSSSAWCRRSFAMNSGVSTMPASRQ